MVRFIFLFCVVVLFEASSAKVEATFFDVGQGNSTLLSFPKGPPLLIDSGSIEHRGISESTRRAFKKSQFAVITEKISSCLPSRASSEEPELVVVITHGDKDHYNWVRDVIEGLGKKRRLRFLLGGTSEDYDKDFASFVKKYYKDGTPSFYAADYAKEEDILPLITCDGVRCEILSACMGKKADTNDKSIVLRIEYGKNSIILTGDATGLTTDRILERFSKKMDSLTSTILQASHHGADSDKANNEEWLTATKPKYIVCSSGTMYSHPKGNFLIRLLAQSSVKADLPLHKLFFGGGSIDSRDNFTVYASFSSPYKYYAAATRLGIYNTTHTGDISFSWDETADSPVFAPKERVVIESVQDYLRSSYGEGIDSLNFRSHTDIIKDATIPNLIELLRPITTLKSLTLSGNLLTDAVAALLVQLIGENLHVTHLDISDNPGITAESHEKIVAAWNHRGLKI